MRGAHPLTHTEESERRDEGRKSAKTTQEPHVSAGGVGGGGAPRGTLSVSVGVLMDKIQALIAGTNDVLQRKSRPVDVAAKLRAFTVDCIALPDTGQAYVGDNVKTAELFWTCLLALCRSRDVAELSGAAVSFVNWFVWPKLKQADPSVPKLKQADPSVEKNRAYLMYWLLNVQHTYSQWKQGQPPPSLLRRTVAEVSAPWRAEASLGYLLVMINERVHMLGSDADKLIELLQWCFAHVTARVQKDSIVPTAAGAAQTTRKRIGSIFLANPIVWKNFWELALQPIKIDSCQPKIADLRGLTHCAQGIAVPEGTQEVKVTWSDNRHDPQRVCEGKVSIRRPRLQSLVLMQQIISSCDAPSSVKHAEWSLASCALKTGPDYDSEKLCAVLPQLMDVWSSAESGSDKPQHLDALIVVIEQAFKSNVNFIGPVLDKVLAKFLQTWPSESCFEFVERFMSSLSKVNGSRFHKSLPMRALSVSVNRSLSASPASRANRSNVDMIGAPEPER